MKIPDSAIAFNDQFSSEDDCLAFLEELRWPRGFVCPNCEHDDGYRITTRRLIQCALCRHQTSVTAGTLFHRTRIPLRIWFYMIFSVGHDKGGASSTRLASELKMHQTTVWHMLHKIRAAMGRRDESIMLSGFIEMDEACLGPHARRPRVSRKDSLKKKPKRRMRGLPKRDGSKRKTQTEVVVLIEQEPHHAGFVAMKVLESVSSENLREFLIERVDEFQHIKTDAFAPHHHALRNFPCTYEAVVCSGPAGCIELPIVHTAIHLLKEFLMGTYFGVARKYLPYYLSEFSFRFNRRDSSRPLWFSLLKACVFGLPFTYAELTS